MTALAIDAVGAITCVGDDAPTTMSSILAEVRLFDDLDVTGADGQPLTGGRTWIEPDVRGLGRVGGLGLIALRECADAAAPAGRCPVVICAAEATDLGGDPARLLAAVTGDGALPIDGGGSAVLLSGRAGLAAALDRAAAHLARGAPGCFVVGVDSLISATRLGRLRRRGRLLDGRNADGFLPSEGAAALFLTARETARSLAVLTGWGEAEEPRVDGSSDPVTGNGLTAALRTAVGRGGEGLTPRALVHDASGALAAFEELALAGARPPLVELAPLRAVAPAISVGETGAAAGALAIAVAAFFLAHRELEGAALVALTGDGPTRAAALLRAPARMRPR